MKTYLGSKMTKFCAIILPLYVVVPILFAVSLMTPPIDTPRFVLIITCLIGSIFVSIFIYKNAIQLYSWGTFDEKGIQIKTLFSKKPIVIEYTKCKSIGIGLYVHGVMGSSLGSKVKYIFFSYQPFNEEYRLNINLWKPSPTRIKIEFNKKLYDYLLTVLPGEQATCLKNDYEKYVKGNIDDDSVS